MKMHVLTSAVLATIASGAVFAASEGGDTWSEVQPVQRSSYSVLQSGPRLAAAELASVGAFGGSEGGDTWSRFVPQVQSHAMGSSGLAAATPIEQR